MEYCNHHLELLINSQSQSQKGDNNQKKEGDNKDEKINKNGKKKKQVSKSNL